MKINKTIHGFTLTRQETIDEVGGIACEFSHNKTGAKLIYIQNDDDNKVFSIGFRTPSNNSTGVAHILEHSVLCGSRKYPLKEPFVELVKGSMNTFLNAMTYPDKTVYPVASTNAADFKNLMDVYLDAVFFPQIYDKPEIFAQEGWHYHIEKPEDAIIYNGVVYNEMKGVFSSPDSVLENKLANALYPDTIYGQESGGDPEFIPDLTYEAFQNFHKTLYHPSNAYIYLYGNGAMAEHLAYIDAEYLSKFDAHPVDSAITTQKAFGSMAQSRFPYPLPKGEETANKDYLSLGFVLQENMSYEEALAFDILCHVLMNNNASPLKKALLDLGICQDVDYSFVASLKQPLFSLTLKNTDEKHKELFLTTVRDTLHNLADEGIDKKAIEAAININEFALVEGEYGTTPKGLIYNLEIYDTWLYGGDPLSRLKYKQAFIQLRKDVAQGKLEGMIQSCFLDNQHQALVSIYPDVNYGDKKDAVVAEKLNAYKESLDDAGLASLIDDNLKLLAYQQSEDSPEDLAKIPKLSLSDIDVQARLIDRREEEFMGCPLLYYPESTGGIVNLKLFFDSSVIPQEDLQYLSLLNKYLASVDTVDYDNKELSQAIDTYTGGISTSLDTYDVLDEEGYRSLLRIKGKTLTYQLDRFFELIESVMLRSTFDNKTLMKDILSEIRMAKENQFLTAGHVVSIQRLQSYYSQVSRMVEEIGGLEFYHFLADIDTNFDLQFDVLSQKLGSILKKVIGRDNLTISLACDADIKEQVLSKLAELIEKLPDQKQEYQSYHFELTAKNEGFMTAGGVQFVSKGQKFEDSNMDYNGSMLVLKSIISMDYLWNRIRVLGGAYGAFFAIGRSRDIIMSSYRDPNLTQTLEAYDDAWQYVENLDISRRELEKYIIGTISSKDVPLSAAIKADIGDSMYFNHLTQTAVQQERDEILGTTLNDIKSFAPLLKEVMDKNCLCALGNEETIKKAESVFGEVKYIK